MNNTDRQLRNLNDVLTEKELLDLLGTTRNALDRLRRDCKLPFCQISRTNRVYLVRDVLDFIERHRVVLNSAGD